MTYPWVSSIWQGDPNPTAMFSKVAKPPQLYRKFPKKCSYTWSSKEPKNYNHVFVCQASFPLDGCPSLTLCGSRESHKSPLCLFHHSPQPHPHSRVFEAEVGPQSYCAFQKSCLPGGRQHLPCVTDGEIESQKIKYLAQGPSLVNGETGPEPKPV